MDKIDTLKLVSTLGNNASFGHATGSSNPSVYSGSKSEISKIESLSTRGDKNSNGSGQRKKKVSVLNPPDGGKFAWRMVGICFVLNFGKEMLRNLIRCSDGFEKDVGTELAKNIYIIFNGFSKFGGVFAAIVTWRYSYKIIGLIGSTMATSGLLLASLMTSSLKELIALTVTCISGVGCGFLEYVTLVICLEYFSTKRVKTLILLNIGTAFSNLIFTILLEIKSRFPEVVLPWTLTFRYQGIGMSAVVVASFFIRPLDLEPEPEVRKVYRHHHMQYSDFSPKDWHGLIKDLTFYLYLIFFLFYDFGEHIPDIKEMTDNQKWAFNEDELITARYVPYMGFVCAALIMCCWKYQTFSNILAVLGPINFIVGLATCVILPYTDFGLIMFYGIVFVLAKHCILWMLLDIIPDEFGRNNTRLCVGVVCFVSGCCEVGSAYARYAAENFIQEPTEEFKAVFILGGAMIMASGLFGVSIRCLIVLFKDPEFRRPKEDFMHVV